MAGAATAMVTIKKAITPQKAESGARRTRVRMVRPIVRRREGGAGTAAPVTVVVIAGESGDDQDRKSTRLNSSHGSISYAVFCLKKKKNTNTRTTLQKKKKNQEKIE